MNIGIYILLLLIVVGFVVYQYQFYKKKKETVDKLFSPLFLMIALLGICIAVFWILFILGIVS